MEPKSIKTMDRILIILGIFLFIFVVTMIVLYIRTGAIPDTLCTCVFAACGGECGVMGWIKTTKDRFRERQWEVEDREEERRPEDDDGHYTWDPIDNSNY